MSEGLLSVPMRGFLDRWFPVVVVGLLALAAGGGYVTYELYTGDDTTTEDRTVGRWTADADIQHAATVQQETTVFSSGQRLENRPLYFTTVAPELNGTYTLSYENTDGNPLSVEATFSRVIRSVEEVNGQAVTHWQNRTRIRNVTTDLADGEEQTTTVSVDIPATQERIRDIEGDLDTDVGEPEILLTVDVVLETTLNGETLSAELTDRIEIVPEENVYRVQATEGEGTTQETTEQVTVSSSPSTVTAVGGALLAVVGLAGAVVLVLSRGRLAVSESERERYEFEASREDLDRWISRGTLPPLDDRTEIPVDTLDDLVDVAIDSDRRVIESDGRFAVLLDDTAYTYTTPTTDDDGTTRTEAEDDHDGEQSDPAHEG